MKYDRTSQIHLNVSCSRCGTSLSGKEKFCPECGRRLKVLKTVISLNDILDLMDRRRSGPSSGCRDEHPGSADISKSTPLEGPCPVKSCMLNRTTKAGCGNYRDGYCTGIVYPTFPPKLKRCDFEDDGNFSGNSYLTIPDRFEKSDRLEDESNFFKETTASTTRKNKTTHDF